MTKQLRALPSQERLFHLFIYAPLSGDFVRRITRNYFVAGSKTGRLNSSGRIVIVVDGKGYFAHRLAWMYVYGKEPEYQIDHINGNPSDNRIANLRDVVASVNKQNQCQARSDNLTGLMGVHHKKNSTRKNKFAARIQVSGKRKELGNFATAEEAHKVYLSAKRNLHAGFTL